jgi:hypothetical protein
MFGTDSTENLHFAISANQLGNGLYKQLQGFIAKYPDTRLIIIDTLQKVSEVGVDKFSYVNDYKFITRLKQATDSYDICLLLVHHTRKQQSDDKFDMISGTNGLLGAALAKRKAGTELWKEPPDPVLETVAASLTAEIPNWSGSRTPTEGKQRFSSCLTSSEKSLVKLCGCRFQRALSIGELSADGGAKSLPPRRVQCAFALLLTKVTTPQA